ncbi:hypothetical protein CPB85DRAFT_353563 [Mucidula mucida]|nr:hypothetical protein CPB85DRAFT_353563 [Mucidula mucida]
MVASRPCTFFTSSVFSILIFCTRGRCLDAAHVDLSSEVLSELQVKYFLSSRMISNFLESRKTFPVRLYSRTEIRQIRVHTLTTVKHASSPQYRQKQTGTNLEICLNSIANVEVQILLEWKHLEESKGKGQLRGKSLFFRLLHCYNCVKRDKLDLRDKPAFVPTAAGLESRPIALTEYARGS